MGKLSKVAALSQKAVVNRSVGLVRTTGDATTNHEGGTAYLRDAKSELFLLGVTNMVSEDTFYETAVNRDDRYTTLIREVTQQDPVWVARFLPWLRTTANMRTAAIVGAAEYARTLGTMTPERRESVYVDDRARVRQVVRSVLQRPDEPGEFIAYWTQETNNRTLPGGVQRGLQDAVKRLYTERASLKYDGTNQPWRMGDVLQLTHSKPDTPNQAILWNYLLDKRYNGSGAELSPDLDMLSRNRVLFAVAQDKRRAFLMAPNIDQILRKSGMTWESLATWLNSPLGKEGWEAIIPSLGIFALVRNLRNILEADVSQEAQEFIAQKISDPEVIKKSRMFPLRFYTAYREVSNLVWSYSLEKAINIALGNVPTYKGRTLVLIDQSWSMEAEISRNSTVNRSEIAALFGLSVALSAESPDVYAYGDSYKRLDIPRKSSLLPLVDKYGKANMNGTKTWTTVRQTFDGHNRIVIVTDEETFDHPTNLPDVPIITFNVAGYKYAHQQSSAKRITVGSLSDAGFSLIQAMDARGNGDWPF